ncbi:MAG: thiol-disulfide oxidoreductase DCC family protein [Bacteroidota bacterium]
MHAPDTHAVVLFDGVCNLCNTSVNYIFDHDPNGYFKVASLQSDEAQALLAHYALPADYLDSLVLIEDGEVYVRSTAALRIARRLDGAVRLLTIFLAIPAPLRDVVYGWIARNRYRWFGKRDTCRLPTPELQERFLAQG